MCHIYRQFDEPKCFEPALSELRTPISLAASAAWSSAHMPTLCAEFADVILSGSGG